MGSDTSDTPSSAFRLAGRSSPGSPRKGGLGSDRTQIDARPTREAVDRLLRCRDELAVAAARTEFDRRKHRPLLLHGWKTSVNAKLMLGGGVDGTQRTGPGNGVLDVADCGAEVLRVRVHEPEVVLSDLYDLYLLPGETCPGAEKRTEAAKLVSRRESLQLYRLAPEGHGNLVGVQR